MKHRLLLISLFMITALVTAQNRAADSLYQLLQNAQNPDRIAVLSYQWATRSWSHPDLAVERFYKAQEKATIAGNDSIYRWCNYRLGEGYESNFNLPEKALPFLELSKDAGLAAQDHYLVARCYRFIGLAQAALGDVIVAREAFDTGYEIARENELHKQVVNILSDLGEMYRFNDDGPQAVRYLEMAMDYYNSIPNLPTGQYRVVRHNLALAYEENGDEQKALAMLQQAYKESNPASFSRAITASNLARLKIKDGQLDQARAYVNEAMSAPSWARNNARMAGSYNNLAIIEIESNHPQEAIASAQKAYDIALELNVRSRLQDATRNLGRAHALAGNYQLAYTYFEKYATIMEDIHDENTQQLLAQQDLQFERMRQELNTSQLALDKQRADQERERWFAIALGCLFLLIIAIIVARARLISLSRKRQQDQLELLKKSSELEQQEQQKRIIKLQLEKEQIEKQREAKAHELTQLDLKMKERELTSQAVTFLQKKTQYEVLLEGLNQLKKEVPQEKKAAVTTLISSTKASLVNFNWDEFEHTFERVNKDFYDRLYSSYPNITPNERRITAFLKMGMSTKDISAITNQSQHSILIARSRLRKKLGLERNNSLTAFIESI